MTLNREIKEVKEQIARLEREMVFENKIKATQQTAHKFGKLTIILLEMAKKKLGFLEQLQMEQERGAEHEA
jgi:hypothetical protein